MSSQRWERRRAASLPSWAVRLLVASAILFGFALWARSAEPLGENASLALATPPAWQRLVLVAPPAPARALSPLDRLWLRAEKARARGDVQTALMGLRTIADEHFEDARTPKAVFMIAALTPTPMERCMALAMVVGLAPASAIATDARQSLPSACAGLF
jgi:hypothetical protein